MCPVYSRHYLTVLSRYHGDGGFYLLFNTRLVNEVFDLYMNQMDYGRESRDMRVDCLARVMRHIVEYGLASPSDTMVRFCTKLACAFVFHCRSISVARLESYDKAISGEVVSATYHGKDDRRHSRPLQLFYDYLDSFDGGGKVVELIKKWESSRPQSDV